jgi:hypothetical protein
MNRALDRIVETGGSFQVLKFELGEQRQSTSRAEVKVSAPDKEMMADIIAIAGIRRIEQPEARAINSSGEFGFMSAGVSSERRVELVVEQVAWDLQHLRDCGGRAIVTAGPVVIHTGGGNHLAALIRHGYIKALLGGNAIAVHDLEQSFYGTSLGVDLQRG